MTAVLESEQSQTNQIIMSNKLNELYAKSFDSEDNFKGLLTKSSSPPEGILLILITTFISSQFLDYVRHSKTGPMEDIFLDDNMIYITSFVPNLFRETILIELYNIQNCVYNLPDLENSLDHFFEKHPEIKSDFETSESSLLAQRNSESGKKGTERFKKKMNNMFKRLRGDDSD